MDSSLSLPPFNHCSSVHTCDVGGGKALNKCWIDFSLAHGPVSNAALPFARLYSVEIIGFQAMCPTITKSKYLNYKECGWHPVWKSS